MKNRRQLSISFDEWVIICSITILAVILIGLLPGMMNSKWFTELIPPFQYFLYNVGFILLTVVLLGVPISHTLKNKVHFETMLRSGISSWLIFSFILDLWQPPFSIGTQGTQLIPNSASLVGTSVDYMLGWVYTKILPFDLSSLFSIPIIGNVSVLFILIYFITPIISVVVSALLLKPGLLGKLLGNNIA